MNWRSFLSGLLGVILAGVVFLAYREWSRWTTVRDFVLPIIAAQARAQQQAPAQTQQAAPGASNPSPKAPEAK